MSSPPEATGESADAPQQQEEAFECGVTPQANGHVDDYSILDHHREVRKEVEVQPLVGPVEPLDGLENEYADNPSFLPKIRALKKQYGGIRRVCKDGCCFYRSYLYGLFEWLLRHRSQIDEYINLITESRKQLEAAGYTESTVDDFYDEFLDQLKLLRESATGPSELETTFQDAGVSNSLVVYARFLTGTHLKLHAPEFEPFLTTHASIHQYVQTEVDPMWVEAEHVQIIALTSVLKVPVRIQYIDASDTAEPAPLTFPEGCGADEEAIHLLYRPGHYDVIYTKTTDNQEGGKMADGDGQQATNGRQA
ncbi:unnamed protein product [Vitrella brassicaformis CCMP3155]|uniref:ubiquitinyl hydrolase 1 n=1 Tax=Vitrella brassicaformis (strain CCMP3155) TaxID=1169540 RepID=A0A0G4ETG7_VITBC|nr:unnamed protein product [Vitrella brassicaformis CCMP3155]|eukprot:CEM01604.1 unnamed protein product [Vitrella brassicaformis CCMP3155]